jgi:hypothetical protein
MYLIYLMAGAIRLPNGSDKSDKSVSLFFFEHETNETSVSFVLSVFI